MPLNKMTLTNRRGNTVIRWPSWASGDQMLELEKQYGNVLLTPLDMEPVVPKDLERFKVWYDAHSSPIRKRRSDAAGQVLRNTSPLFRSISTFVDSTSDPIWEENYRKDLYDEFPELRDLVMQFPFKTLPPLSLWSSMRVVNPHRDEGPWSDIPCAFRSMVYDDNPSPTLYVQETPGTTAPVGPATYWESPPDTNSFAWNNLRVEHGSMYRGLPKVILIVAPVPFDIAKYANLISRSVQKYGGQVLRGQYAQSEFRYAATHS